MKHCLRTNHLSFQDILFYPDMCIPEHEVTFISGPSGCGKSTLFKMFNGTLSPGRGHVFFQENDVADLDKITLRRDLLLVNQAPYLFAGTVRENYDTFHQYHGSPCPTTAEIQYYLKLCCMDVSPDSTCVSMSGGERQRIFLSIALSMSPSVLLLDEPTSALNSELSVGLLQNIIDFAKRKKMTPLIISHDLSLQHDYAEHVIELPPR